MAGTEGHENSSSQKNCKYCQKSVINSVAKCLNCEATYHTSCALRVAGLTAVGKNNLVKCCVKEDDFLQSKFASDNAKKLLEAKNEIVRNKDEIILELREKEKLLYSNIRLLEEKIKGFQECETTKNVNNALFPSQNRLESSATRNTPVRPRNVDIDTFHNHNLKVSDPGQSAQQQQQQQKQKPEKLLISSKAVSNGILQAQSLSKMQEMQNLVQHNVAANRNDDWQVVKRKSRRFLVGRNEDSRDQIQAVPKYVPLHVTRLVPGTRPDQLRKFLEPNFDGVTCEEHISKHPQLYSSMKVTVRQEDFKNIWKKEVWPNGVLVSRFFVKKRMPPNQEDPQTQRTQSRTD